MSKVYEVRFLNKKTIGTYASEEDAIEAIKAELKESECVTLNIGERDNSDAPYIRIVTLTTLGENKQPLNDWDYYIYEVENEKENETMEVINVTENEAVTEQQVKERMFNDVIALFGEYGIDYRDCYVREIINEWYKAKAELRAILRKYPQWDEMAQAVILKERSVIRAFDENGAAQFKDWMRRELARKDMNMERAYVGYLYEYMTNSFENALGNLINLPELEKNTTLNDILALNEYKNMPKPVNGQKWSRFFGGLCKKWGLNTITDVRTEIHTDPATGEIVKREKDYGYNYYIALLGDSINPLEIPGKTFLISINIIDYLTMSFGNNWASCHTIDKRNKRKCEHHYDGQYCGGTLDYALDNVTMISYFVDEANENKHGRNEYHHYGNDVPYCRRDKEHRAVTAWQNDKLYVARVYPDGRDGGEAGIGAQFREIIQQIFAECLNVSNIWTTKKGTESTNHYVRSNGCLAAYPDWSHCEDGAISFLRRIDGILNEEPIKICGGVICPNCGERHSYSDNILCQECAEDEEYYGYCNWCEEGYYEGDEVWMGEWYDVSFCCYDCARAAGYRLDHYGNWIHTDDAIYCVDDNDYYPEDDDSLVYCEDDDNNHLRENCHYCDGDANWYSPDTDGVTTYDGKWFHDEDTAEENGYVLCDDDDEWHHAVA